ncbi:MAG: sulfur carrier protein ThiS [Vicingaceae bacterium]
MKITVNNNIQSIKTSSSVEMMVAQLNIESKGIAIAVNQTVVSKKDWSSTHLEENDNITIIKATQGG